MSRLILIVEDEILVGLDLSEALHEAGFRTRLARDMFSALRIALEDTVDLATMDVNLAHDTDGVETAIRLRQAHDVPSVFVSASLDGKTRERAQASGPVGFLDKPVATQQLVGVVTRYLAQADAAGPRA
ncbi:response regulator [Paracoccus sediminis]|uniref:Response regulator n=1 Tax=Paracoccus sediminis TaxID=1214787 RepID=A0A238WQ03_9RHOB|nr:response regulator [Paracoccus sediminis]TBN50416.1 response regulator [Paracoccus sediminis]SNR48413.1 Response regulator receiver domain-containing protein [Paracoccus sediminis]